MSEQRRSRPSIQFYPDDWLRDPALRRCSPSARGLWIDLICLMHAGDPYGHLRTGGADMLPGEIARATGFTAAEVRRCEAELDRAGVFSRTDAGTIFCRRMVRDEAMRQKRASYGHLGSEFGSLGGRPPKQRDGVMDGVYEKPHRGRHDGVISERVNNPPSSSSSLLLGLYTKHTTQPPPNPPKQAKTPSATPSNVKSPTAAVREELKRAAIRAWNDACGYMRDWQNWRHCGRSKPEPSIPAHVKFAVESVGHDRMREALFEPGGNRELGFIRRDFLLAFEAQPPAKTGEESLTLPVAASERANPTGDTSAAKAKA